MRAMIVVLFVAVGCRTSAGPARTGPAPTGEATGEAPLANELAVKVRAIQLRMHLKFAAAHDLEQAIAFGNLDRAREQAKIIMELVEPEILKEWQPYVEDVREAARQVHLSTNLVTAATRSAILGRECAQCHVSTRAKIQLPTEPAPRAGERLAAEMASHQWATSRMWDGLIVPADEPWHQGAKTLTQAPLAIVAEGDLPPARGVSDDVARLRLLAQRAMQAVTVGDRAEVYGELLATCAGCHATIR